VGRLETSLKKLPSRKFIVEELSCLMEISFEGKRVLVTGAGKGIGKEICGALMAAKATVIALSRTSDDLKELQDQHLCHEAVQCDLANTSEIPKAMEQIGDVDCLVNNAGIAPLEPFLEVSEAAFDRTMSVNVKAVMVLSQLVAKNMIARKVPGTIVNVSSVASKSVLKDHTSYCVSKAALDMLTKMMCFELGQYGIRVNSINPTVIMTDMGKKAWGDPEKAGPVLKRISTGRFAEMNEAANLVLYLLSGKSTMINGAIVNFITFHFVMRIIFVLFFS
jgi:L-xylulose reductase